MRSSENSQMTETTPHLTDEHHKQHLMSSRDFSQNDRISKKQKGKKPEINLDLSQL